MRLPSYPSFKPSDVDWLGDLPEHWEALPLKRRHRVVNGGTPSSAEDSYWDGDINWITPEDLGRNECKRIGHSRRTISREGLMNCGAQLVPRDSIALSTRAPIGHVAIMDRESCTNQGCRALIPRDGRALADFVYYTLVASRPVLQASGKGTTFTELAAGALGEHEIPVPPVEEQHTIAGFLDRETAKLDALMAKKRTLIERLKEKRTALISCTVTRGLPPAAARAAGLDPHPKLKPSGIAWLGEVPRHWEVKRLRYVGDAIIGLTFDPADITAQGDGTLVLRASNVLDGRIVLDDNVFVSTPVPERLITRVGDILICSRSGSRALIGKNAMIGEKAAGLTFGTFMTVFRSPSNAYLFYVFNSSLFDYQSGAYLTSTINQLTIGNLYSFEVPIPPVGEQVAIAAYLTQETAQIDSMVAKVATAIERLQEYRTALITAAVTGKIDVRGISEQHATATAAESARMQA